MTTPVRLFAARLAVLLGLVAIAFGAQAQRDDALPARVGRVASVEGMLRHAPEAGDAWSTIGLNYPIAQGDNLWTGPDSRAEVDYGGGEFRLGANTNVHVSRLDERQLALFVASGRTIVRVRYLEPGDSVRVDTSSTQLALNRAGLYRIDVDAGAQRTTLTVREGEADMASISGIASVFPGQVATIATHDATADVRSAGGIDGFDAWSAERDRYHEAPRANDYVSPAMVGAADLYRYGEWNSYPEYGAVWLPTVDPDWAPYRFGYWTWLAGFGYTWVDSAPWGYAPFHYGRWVHVGGRWGWCPGRFVARPAWAPALVAWYEPGAPAAGRGHVVGWVPLGWSEPYVPSWRCGERCFARYNRPYAVPAARPDSRPSRYANAGVPNAMTVVPAATLTTERPVARNRVPLPADRSVAPPLAATPPAVPPAAPRTDAVRPGNGAPVPAGARPRPAPSAPLVTPPMSSTLPAAPRSPVVPVPAGGVAQPPAPAIVRPVPVPPSTSLPAPSRSPPSSFPLPPMPSAPVPGTSPAPPAAVVPMPVHPASPARVPAPPPSAPAAVPAPVPVPAPAPVPPAPPRSAS